MQPLFGMVGVQVDGTVAAVAEALVRAGVAKARELCFFSLHPQDQSLFIFIYFFPKTTSLINEKGVNL